MIGKFMQHSVFLQYELILLYIDIYIYFDAEHIFAYRKSLERCIKFEK